MIKIQTILIIPTYKEYYYMKDGDKKTVKISHEKYFKLYDKSFCDESIIVLPPITKTLNL